jgi:hypothetical protein
MTKKLEELSREELSALYNNSTEQFIAALQNDRPIEELQHLRDCLTEIRAEMKRREGRKER